MAVKALKDIGRKLGKNDWDFSKDPCSGEGTWTANVVKGRSVITCVCSFNHNTTCRIVRMSLKGHNLTGVVPSEFTRLCFLTSLESEQHVYEEAKGKQKEHVVESMDAARNSG